MKKNKSKINLTHLKKSKLKDIIKDLRNNSEDAEIRTFFENNKKGDEFIIIEKFLDKFPNKEIKDNIMKNMRSITELENLISSYDSETKESDIESLLRWGSGNKEGRHLSFDIKSYEEKELDLSTPIEEKLEELNNNPDNGLGEWLSLKTSERALTKRELNYLMNENPSKYLLKTYTYLEEIKLNYLKNKFDLAKVRLWISLSRSGISENYTDNITKGWKII